MPRAARIVAEGFPHHVTQRGNRRVDVFLDDEDRLKYLEFCDQYSRKYCLEIIAYCLMSNHIHLVVLPREPESLAKAMASIQKRYAQFFNWKYSMVGHLWQSRFFSCVLDESHLLAAVRYVERNPQRAGLVGRPWDYRWSSARGHLGNSPDRLLSKAWPTEELLLQWRDFLAGEEGAQSLAEIRKCTRRGFPLGSAEFISKIEQVFGLKLVMRPWGRPRKQSPT
jgi:putative transposase